MVACVVILAPKCRRLRYGQGIGIVFRFSGALFPRRQLISFAILVIYACFPQTAKTKLATHLQRISFRTVKKSVVSSAA